MAAYKSICITGANRGLGLEFIRLFLQLPQPPKHIISLCRNPDGATELKELSTKHPNVIHIFQLDITEISQFDKVVEQVRKVVGTNGLNLLINNAGVYNKEIKASIEAFTKEDLLDHYNVNTVSPLLLTKAFHPLLKQASTNHENELDVRKSVVVFVSSILGCYHPNMAFNHPYRFSKAALNMVTHCLASEWKDQGILVTVLHPGWVKTDMGGPGADIDINTSVSGMVKVLLDITEKNRGKLFKYDGTPMEW